MTTPQWLLVAMNQDCTIYNRVAAGVDEYGNQLYESQAVATSKCLLQPVSQAEIQLGRAGVGTFILFLPAEVEVMLSSFTAFEIGGRLYEAEGPAAMYSELFQPGLHHVEFNVVRSTA